MRFMAALTFTIVGVVAFIDVTRPGDQYLSAIVFGFCMAGVWRTLTRKESE